MRGLDFVVGTCKKLLVGAGIGPFFANLSKKFEGSIEPFFIDELGILFIETILTSNLLSIGLVLFLQDS